MLGNLLSSHKETRSQKLRRKAGGYTSETVHSLTDYLAELLGNTTQATARGTRKGAKYGALGLGSLATLLGESTGKGTKYGAKYAGQTAKYAGRGATYAGQGVKKAAKTGAAVYAAKKLAPREAKTAAKTGLGLGGALLVGAGAVVGGALLTRTVVRAGRHIDLEGKVVVVTGASRGLGLEVCRVMVDHGARVAICSRDEAELRQAEEELVGRGGEVLARQCDVTDRRQVKSFVEQIESLFGPIDCLINNAGTIAVGPIESMRIEDYRKAMNVHFYGPLNFMYEVTPGMQRRGFGRVVNVASIGGKVPAPHMTAYVASKHALVGLSEGCRSELAKDNVLVTTVCPGLVRTGSSVNAHFKGDNAVEEYRQFSAAGNTPGLSIASEKMAKRIVDAMVHGDAEVITPLPAALQALLHGIAPGIGTELAAVAGRFMPRSGSHASAYESFTGKELADEAAKPDRFNEIEHRQAERNREL